VKFGGGFGWTDRVRVCRALGLGEREEKRRDGSSLRD